MTEISLFRLYLLRAMYLFIVVGFGLFMWPSILRNHQSWELMEGVVNCMLVAFWTLSVLGLRYPLQMLPILLWELIWKSLWLLAVALPQWSSGHMDQATQANVIACAVVVLIPFVIPWRYFITHYLKKAGDPWLRRADPQPSPAPAGVL
ncbi:hypothetical protein FNU76_02870 [Chitinimonas arctica]|uniref:Uncharacterized protein n=1 Tax=Chitinimonas arctica TaxID=2594795 RepID=A0A516SB55_9NEIS|nr:hypothetical protein [Chitinimonas arctica]QDQ25381.1 hypothetical protein FNU76_02870 [Chitinimonas arctica]